MLPSSFGEPLGLVPGSAPDGAVPASIQLSQGEVQRVQVRGEDLLEALEDSGLTSPDDKTTDLMRSMRIFVAHSAYVTPVPVEAPSQNAVRPSTDPCP